MRKKALLSVVLSAVMVLGTSSPALAAGQVPASEVTAGVEASVSESQDVAETVHAGQDDSSVSPEQETADGQESVEREKAGAEVESEEGNIEEKSTEEESNGVEAVEEKEEDDSDIESKTDSVAEEEQKLENLVGAEEERVSVGENVTAGYDSETRTLTFYSQDGTLSGDWKNKLNLEWGMLYYTEYGGFYDHTLDGQVIEKITISDDSDVMYLPTDCSLLFGYLRSLQSIDLSKADTSNVTNMSFMFGQCYSLQTLDASGFDTSDVTNMSDMFYMCESLQTLDVSGFDTSNVTDMSNLFNDCRSLQALHLSGFDISNLSRGLESMFCDCSSLQTLDISGFDMSGITNTFTMFENCDLLDTIFTPVNVQTSIGLPHLYVDASGANYKSLPEGRSDSIQLTRREIRADDRFPVGENVTAGFDRETGTVTFYVSVKLDVSYINSMSLL